MEASLLETSSFISSLYKSLITISILGQSESENIIMIGKIKFAPHFFILFALLAAADAHANICGTDFQNFNPTTNGLDFVTTQSSETLKPCVINMGLFFNYAENSLTYSQSLNANVSKGQKRQDKILGADLSLGMGLTDRWDFGISMPAILWQEVTDQYYVAAFEETGFTEIKANTKYRLMGDERGGIAAILSVNRNLIQDNPFAGENPGLTWNYELAADTTFQSNWAFGVNVGYRQRNPGDPIPNSPFVPMKDQWIYSVAGSYLFDEYDSKLILELYGSRPANPVDQDTDRGLTALETLAGIKHDYNQNTALHFGMTKQIDSALGGAEWRAYAGINWTFGPVCKTEATQPEETPKNYGRNADEEIYKLNMGVLFAFDSDDLNQKSMASLESFFKGVTSKSYKNMIVGGHTDSIGSAAYNQDLSERRARAVRDYLMEKFKVPAKKIQAIGYGMTQPIADNGNYQGRQANRRVELIINRGK